MKLFRRQSTNANVPPELQPYYEGNPDSNLPDWRRWLLIAVAILVLIGIAIGIYLWKPWQSSNTSSTHKTPHSSSSTKNGGSTGTHTPQSPQVPSSPSNTGGTSTPAPTTPSTPGANANNQPLTNTGPGDTLALFSGVTLIGGAAYQIHLRRRVASNR